MIKQFACNINLYVRWSVETGDAARVLTATEGKIKSLKFENSGKFLISASKNISYRR